MVLVVNRKAIQKIAVISDWTPFAEQNVVKMHVGIAIFALFQSVANAD